MAHSNNDPLVDIQDLKVQFHSRGGILKAVDGVSLSIARGETLGLVGESGCGKSVTASSLMRLVPCPPGEMAGGKILFEGRDVLRLSEAEMKKMRGNRISMIFQEPMTSLNPVFTVGDQVGEVLRLHQGLNKKQARERAAEIFDTVGIPAARQRVTEYPHQMSGGMRQRVIIAMALACNPRLMIADEPTTALDVTIQAQILNLMNKLKEETEAAILFITHDLGVIAEMAQNVAVMYAGKVMEYTDVKTLFAEPAHPYTVGLMSSIPVLGRSKGRNRLSTIPGVVPSLFTLPTGCLFSERCTDSFDRCFKERPRMCNVGSNHQVRCHKYD